MERYAILNDVHFPYECRNRYPLAISIMKEVKPSRIYLNGDIGEFQNVSSWPSHPTEKGLNFMQELQYLNKKFDELCEIFPDVPVTYICGNHEHRLFRYIRDISPHLWGVMPDCPTLLGFERRPSWKFVDYTNDQLVRCGSSKLYLRHEPLGFGTHCAAATAAKSYVDVAFGHTHTFQVGTHRKFGPTPYVVKSYSLGWLGDKSRHVFDYRKPSENWVEGFTIVECDEHTGSYQLEFINLQNIPAFYRGTSYGPKGRSRTLHRNKKR